MVTFGVDKFTQLLYTHITHRITYSEVPNMRNRFEYSLLLSYDAADSWGICRFSALLMLVYGITNTADTSSPLNH
jgi:hypothetical protein